jgi:hypothetical protein
LYFAAPGEIKPSEPKIDFLLTWDLKQEANFLSVFFLEILG